MKKQVTVWMALAKTPQTRARIRRWAYVQRVFLPLAVIGFVGILFMIAVTMFYVASGPEHLVYLWWAWSVVTAITIVGFVLWMWSSSRLLVARYADAQTSVGKVVDVTEIEDRDPDVGPVYRVTVLAKLPEGSLQRVLPMNDAPQLGQLIRLRHNTFDAENVDDVLFDGLEKPIA